MKHLLKRTIPILLTLIVALTVTVSLAQSGHEGHDHGPQGHEPTDADDHKEEQAADHDEHQHDAGEEGGDLVLTEAQKRTIGLVVSKAAAGMLYEERRLLGEVTLNEDTLVHVVPRVPGVAVEVNKSLGDLVKAGDVLAILDSAMLGEAKADYFERYNELQCCNTDLERARTISKNTEALLLALEANPALEELRKFDTGDMGAFRVRLLVSYAEYVVCRRLWEREKELLAQAIVSENALLDSQNAFEKSQAKFLSEFHNAKFESVQQMYDEERDTRVGKMKLKSAERKLRILGLTQAEINALSQVGKGKKDEVPKAPAQKRRGKQKRVPAAPAPAEEHGCTDPNCTSCKAAAQALSQSNANMEEAFSRIALVAPQDGTIIERHISRGEKVNDEVSVFTVADLTSVWVNLKVPAQDINMLNVGQHVFIESAAGAKVEGVISLIGPVIDEATRTTIARIVVDNPWEVWKPGSFVTGHVQIAEEEGAVVVPSDAVQNMEGEDMIFISDAHGFEPVPVTVGHRNRSHVEIVAGLAPGTPYVSKGAFELKAIMITSNMDPHAGHGH